MLESAHVKDAFTLMESFGFNGKKLNIAQLLAVIDEELQDSQQSEESLAPILKVLTYFIFVLFKFKNIYFIFITNNFV